MRFDRAHVEVAAHALRLRFRPWITNDRGRRIYVDPGDKRAWRMARAGGAVDLPAVAAWRKLAEWVRPDVVLDVGANYGEVILSADYPGAAVHVFEPNPPVVERLRLSIATLGTVHAVAASDREGMARLSTQPRLSSGVSSLDREGTDSVEVQTVRIDDLGLSAERLLFKIDVEGHERAVLRGMERLLGGVPMWAGLVESDDVLDAPYCERITEKDVLISSASPPWDAGRPR